MQYVIVYSKVPAAGYEADSLVETWENLNTSLALVYKIAMQMLIVHHAVCCLFLVYAFICYT